MNSHRIIVAMYIAAIVILTYSEIKQEQRMPQPKRYLYATLVFLMLAFIEMLGATSLAAAFSVGVVLAMAYTFLMPGQKGILGGVGDLVGAAFGAGGSIVGGVAGTATK